MLFIVSTPIGNLEDISFRAINTLKLCDYILAEDTRKSRILCNKYHIKNPLKSYHKFSEKKKLQPIISDLKNGKKIALISDAGTPGISDPGELLIQKAIENDITITPIPGPTSITSALVASGLSTTPFQFIGFLPKKTGPLKIALFNLLLYSGTTICFESPERLVETLTLLSKIDSDCLVVVAREITKKFESFYRGKAHALLKSLKKDSIKGEIVLMITPTKDFQNKLFTNTPSDKLVDKLQTLLNLTRPEAIKQASNLLKIPKTSLYKQLHQTDIFS